MRETLDACTRAKGTKYYYQLYTRREDTYACACTRYVYLYTHPENLGNSASARARARSRILVLRHEFV